MSNFEHKPGSGTLFKNTKEDVQAKWSGNIKLPDGTDCFIDLYAATDRETGELRKDRDGQPFYNVRVKPKDKQAGQSGGYDQSSGSDYERRNAPEPDLDDDLPF